MSKPRNKQEEKAFSKIVDEVADAMVIKAYQDAVSITDDVYYAILRSMRNKIDTILKNKENNNE